MTRVSCRRLAFSARGACRVKVKWGSALSEPHLMSCPEISKMAEEKQTPKYDDATVHHGALPSRPTGNGKPMPRGPLPLDIPILNQLRGKRVILASASPRRKQIFSMVRMEDFSGFH
jgi:hypothetical protein